MLSHYQLTHPKNRSFYDDYESESIALWDAIKALQEKVRALEKELKKKEVSR